MFKDALAVMSIASTDFMQKTTRDRHPDIKDKGYKTGRKPFILLLRNLLWPASQNKEITVYTVTAYGCIYV